MNAGRAEVREVIARAKERRASGRPTIFFLDEIHRFNKAQQDALLPAVEDGLLTLIGATTENPYFEVNSALLSRCQIYEFRALEPERSRTLIRRALSDERGIPDPPGVSDEALEMLGDEIRRRRAGRSGRSRAGGRDDEGRRGGRDRGRGGRGRAPAQGPALRPGRGQALRLHLGLDQGDARVRRRRVDLLPRRDARGRRGPALHRPPHGDLRLRGHRQRRPPGARDRDRGRAGRRPGRAARVRAQPLPGRRLPRARSEVERLHDRDLTRRPRHVREHGAAEPPPYLQDAHYPGAKQLGRGEGYRYPHDEPGAVTDQPLAPESVRDQRFYEPTDRGLEAELRERLARLRKLLGGHQDR